MKPGDRTERLDFSERWLRDGLRAIDPPGGLVALEADMSAAAALRTRMKENGTPVTYNALIVYAAARALTQNPDLHKLLAGNVRIFPATVDICLSLAGDAAVTPVLIIEDAGSKSWTQIGNEIRERADLAREEDAGRLEVLKKWGWIVPLARIRRAVVRHLLNRPGFRRKASGTFQVTVVSTVDYCVPFLFNTAGALGAGRIQDRVVAARNRVEIRPTVMLTCCVDHKIWNGMDAAKFLNGVKDCLESIAGAAA